MKVSKRQLQKIIKEEKARLLEADPYGDPPRPGEQGSADGPAIGGSFPGDTEDLDYFQDQVEEAYSRLAAEADDIEHLLPEHIIAKITKTLNSIEQLNMAISELRK